MTRPGNRGGVPSPRRDAEPAERRRPLLADRFVTRRFSDWERAVHPKAIEQLQRGVRNARRFVLDDNATLRLAEIIDRVPDLLVREHQFARAPYDLTWVEFPAHVLWNFMRERNPDAYEGIGRWGDPELADHTLGYLIDHERVNVICGGTTASPDGAPQIMPIQYRLHTPMAEADRVEFRRLAGMTETWHLEAFLWGSTFDRLSHADRAIGTDRNTVGLLPFNPLHRLHGRYNDDDAWAEATRGSIGELRNIIAILLVLNRPSLTKYIRNANAGRGFYKGKLMPYLSHTTITIDIDAVPTLKLIGTPAGDAEPKRRGEVRGHYRHDETARSYARIAGCIHEYQPTHGPEAAWAAWPDAPPGVPGDPGCVRNWVCAACGGKRWWRRETERGDAAKGFVNHDAYEVTTGR